MNLEKAKEIVEPRLYKEMVSDFDYGKAQGFIEGYNAALEAAAKISEDYGNVALLMSQTQAKYGSQNTQKGIAIAGERIAKLIKDEKIEA